jgi:tetratricopeptide (TPR) repeat protein
MEFDPSNAIIRLCLHGMGFEDKGEHEEAAKRFLQAWNESTNDFEKFTAAYYIARHQEAVQDRLEWLGRSFNYALKINDVTVKAAFPSLYSKIAECFEELGDIDKAKKYHGLAASLTDDPTDNGPFYHGTKADLQIGDLLTPGATSNYKSDLIMNHIYFTALANGAGLAAALAKSEGRERVYIVEPTGTFEHDPNVTNKRFPGNPTRSYRSKAPLKIVGEVTHWVRQTPEELRKWRERLSNVKGEIIN